MTRSDSTDVLPFRISVPLDDLTDLRSRLRSTRFAADLHGERLPGGSWSTGVPASTLRRLVSEWQRFDWPAFETRVNEVPQFTTSIDGQVIHFVHVRSAEPNAVPLLLTHGWPGSFLEFLDIIGPLTDPVAHGGDAADAFDVVIPSLPGFGFSTPLSSAGWTTRRIAETWVELMTRLGYERFATQGGDIGALIAPEIGRVAPDRTLGVHINGASAFVSQLDDEAASTLTELERDRMRRVAEFMRDEFGYIALQSTRPGLVGTLLTDSPVAQLAWIVDKFQAWTHPTDAPADEVVGLDILLANASLYWFTASAGSSAYVGYAQNSGWGEVPAISGVPTGVICFAHDIGIRRFVEASNSVVRWTDVTDRGGHFAALEEPAMLVDDIREFLRPLRPRA